MKRRGKMDSVRFDDLFYWLMSCHRCANINKAVAKRRRRAAARQGFCFFLLILSRSLKSFLFVVCVLSCSHLKGVHPVPLLVEVVHEIPARAHAKRSSHNVSVTSSREERV